MVSTEVQTISQQFATALHQILGDKLHGVYIYGAAAFPDAVPTGDIDFHVILHDPLTDVERTQLEKLHDDLAAQYPPLGAELDGYYLLLADARHTALPCSQLWTQAVDNAWALHRAHILAGRCIVFYGPDPATIYPPATWPELEAALDQELDYIERHLNKYPDYCILNLCRLVYSFQTKDVVISKAQAAIWAEMARPHWQKHIELARKSYAGQATPADRTFMLAEVPKIFGESQREIQTYR